MSLNFILLEYLLYDIKIDKTCVIDFVYKMETIKCRAKFIGIAY